MIIIVATTFIVSWSPFYMVSLISQVQQNSFLRRSNFLFTMLSTHLVGFVNSIINPFLYISLSSKFRSSFKEILNSLVSTLCFIVCCGRHRQEQEVRCRLANTAPPSAHHQSPPQSSGGERSRKLQIIRGSWHSRALRRPCLFHFALRGGRGMSSDSSSPGLSDRVNTTLMTIEPSAVDNHNLASAALQRSSPRLRGKLDNFIHSSPHNDCCLQDLAENHTVNVIVNPNTDSPDCTERLLGNGYVASSSTDEDIGSHTAGYRRLNNSQPTSKQHTRTAQRKALTLNEERLWTRVSDVPAPNLKQTTSSDYRSKNKTSCDEDMVDKCPRLWDVAGDKNGLIGTITVADGNGSGGRTDAPRLICTSVTLETVTSV